MNPKRRNTILSPIRYSLFLFRWGKNLSGKSKRINYPSIGHPETLESKIVQPRPSSGSIGKEGMFIEGKKKGKERKKLHLLKKWNRLRKSRLRNRYR